MALSSKRSKEKLVQVVFWQHDLRLKCIDVFDNQHLQSKMGAGQRSGSNTELSCTCLFPSLPAVSSRRI